MEITLTTSARDGTRLGYRVLRSKQHHPVIVLIHGLASNLTRWSEFMDNTSLKNTWDLVRVDLRGHGTSMARGRISRTKWIEDLSTVLNAEGYSEAVLVGHSLGAQVALLFAVKYPEKTRGLILIDPVFPAAISGLLGIAKRIRAVLWLLIRLIWLVNFFGLKRNRFPARDLRLLDDETRKVLASDPNADIAKLYMAPWKDLKYLPSANYLQDLFEVTRPLPLRLEEVKAPVLVLLSAGASVSHGDTTQEHIARLPNSETATIDANHWLLTERPDEARHEIEQWCTRLANK
jgi:esterase